MKDKTNCGFSKWSIGIDDNYNVIVELDRYPIGGALILSDASSDDFRKLGEMFLSIARESEKKPTV